MAPRGDNSLSGNGRNQVSSRPILLDGGVATELERRGMQIEPPWSTSIGLASEPARQKLADIHASYIEAGADVLTANTFRTSRQLLRTCGLTEQDAIEFVKTAIALPKRAAKNASRPNVRVAASIAPVADCYRPELAPHDDVMWSEHKWQVQHMALAGADLILCETMNSQREAEIAVQCATSTGLPTWISFVCDVRGALLSGESLILAAKAVASLGADMILINCTAMSGTIKGLESLREAGLPDIGFYPNNEERSTPSDGAIPPDARRSMSPPERFAANVADVARQFEVAAVGGCCGTAPEHILALAQALKAQGLR